MDIPYGLLTKLKIKIQKIWKRSFLDDKAVNKQQKELKALEKELRIVKQERDMLKSSSHLLISRQIRVYEKV